jgi:hypothetical protein
MLLQERKTIKYSLCKVIPCPFINWHSRNRHIFFLKKRLEYTKSMKCLFLRLQMFLYFCQLRFGLLFCLILIFWHILYLYLKSYVLGFYSTTILTFLKIDLIRECPSKNLYTALIKDNIERIFFHLERVLMVNDWVKSIYKSYWR